MSNLVAKVEISTDKVPNAREVLDLFKRLNWAKMDYRDPERFQRALENSYPLVTAWDGSRLAGICRAITDGECTAYITAVGVEPDYQGGGIGTALIERALELLEGYDTIALITGLDKVEYWEKFGFVHFEGGMMLRRW